MEKAFPDSEIKYVGNQWHTCDIEIVDEKILVEVKAVKSKTKQMNEKFIRDLESHEEIHMGVFINLFDENLITHLEFQPLRLYVNYHDFSPSLIRFIKTTNESIDKMFVSTPDVSKQREMMAINDAISEATTKLVKVKIENIVKDVLAQIQVDQFLGIVNESNVKLTKSSVSNGKYMQRNQDRIDNIEQFKQYIKEFIFLNSKQFHDGYLTNEARAAADEYIMSKGLPHYEIKHIEATLSQYLRRTTNAPIRWIFKQGAEQQLDFEMRGTEDMNESMENETNELKLLPASDAPNVEEALNMFCCIPKTQNFITRNEGYMSDRFRSDFKYFVTSNICSKYAVSCSRYTDKIDDILFDRFVQVHRNNHNWYIRNEGTDATNTLNKFDQFAIRMIKANQFVKCDNSFMALYNKELLNNEQRLTRTYIIYRLNILKQTI